jgi:hypothetical protein
VDDFIGIRIQAAQIDSAPIALVQETPVDSTFPQSVQDDGDTVEPADQARMEEWSEETHGKGTDPNNDVVFPEDEANRVDITMARQVLEKFGYEATW